MLETAAPVGGREVDVEELDGPTGVWDIVPDGAMVVLLLGGGGMPVLTAVVVDVPGQ